MNRLHTGSRQQGGTIKHTALALFSGGLDSQLAVRLMQMQGIEVTAIHFTSPFFGEVHGESGPTRVHAAAQVLGVPLEVVPLGADYLEMLRNPSHGYGKAVNPCVDCHAWMFRVVRDLMPEHGAGFVVSGEVLGQRPMSQRRDTLRVVERESGLEGLLLRPLSATCLPPTIPEREGWVNRDLLQGISGRSRKEQMRLAVEFGLRDFPAPAGGCLLTEISYASKIRDIFLHSAVLDPRDFRLLRNGRHFRIGERTKVIIGRSEADNLALERSTGPGDALLRWVDGGSPAGLVVGEINDELLERAARILLRYTKAGAGQECRVKVILDESDRMIMASNVYDESSVASLRI